MDGCGQWRVGASGWQYDHWRGPFYPLGLAKARWFDFYAARFDSVEVNSTFYHLPRDTTCPKWRHRAPPGFVYAVKAYRLITHFKRLRDTAGDVAAFLERVDGLGPALGPILFQLPPSLRCDAGLLDAFLEVLPPGRRYAVEVRHENWFAPQVARVMERHGAAFCVFELGRLVSPVLTTADFAYIRLHGPAGRYAGDYAPEALAAWAGRIRAWGRAGLDAYCYFDNDELGYAVKNAAELKAMLGAC